MFDASRASCGGTPCVIGIANRAERYREDRSVRVHDTPFEQRCAGQMLAIHGLQKAPYMDWAGAELCVNMFSASAQSTALPGQALVDWTLGHSVSNVLCRFALLDVCYGLSVQPRAFYVEGINIL